MSPYKFVHEQVEKEAVKRGAKPMIAKKYADEALAIYKKNRFKSMPSVIMSCIEKAIKETKKQEESLL